MNKSLFDALNIAAQELFGQLEGTGDEDFDSTFVDELQQMNNWRKSILEFSHNLTQILEQYHSIDMATNKDSIRSLIENISKFNSIPTKESDKRIIIRHRGLSPSIKGAGEEFCLNSDYVISVGDCVMDNQQLDYLVRFGIMDAGELRKKLKKTFDFLQSQNIYIIDICYNNWDMKDQQTVHDALLSWGHYFTALKKGFGVVLDGTGEPDPNLTILAVLNKLNLEKFQGTVDKVHKLMIQEKLHEKFNDVNSIYDAIFLIDELKSKLFRSPIEINNNKFIQIWRHCFDKNGKFNRIKFNQHRNRFLDWENAFYMFWADLKSVLITEDRETILNCIIRFIADSKSHNEYVDYILKDFYSYPLHLQFSDRDSLFVANLLLFKDYVNRTYDFGHTPGEVLFSNELLNEETVRQLRLKITDKWKDKFLQKHRTIKKDLKLAMKANAQQDNVMPIQLLINILRELFIFLTIVWDKEFKSIVRDTVKEYANDQSELYHSENNPEVLLPLLQFFQITILCLVKLGDESDVDLLHTIRNREKTFLSMKGLLPKDYATHKKMISKIMSVVDEGVKTLKEFRKANLIPENMIGALLVDPIVNPIYQRRKKVEEEIQLLNRQVEEMDGKISNFLADPQNKPHPRHLELIEKIQEFRIEQSATNTHLRALVDRLQWKVHYSKKAWKIFFDNAEARQLKKESNLPSITERGNPDKKEDLIQSKAQYSIDTLWEIQIEKLRVYGQTEEKETKSEFKDRMLREYRKLSQNKKTNQKIFLTFDKDLAYCKLDLK